MSDAMEIQGIGESPFPSLEVLQRYLQGQASAEEKAKIDGLMEDDPMMADAVEGLSLIKDQAALQASLQRLHTLSQKRLRYQIDRRELNSKRQSRVKARHYLPYMGVAAAAIGLLMVTFYMVQELGRSPQATSEAFAMETDRGASDPEAVEIEGPSLSTTDAELREELPTAEAIPIPPLARDSSLQNESSGQEIAMHVPPPRNQIGLDRPSIPQPSVSQDAAPTSSPPATVTNTAPQTKAESGTTPANSNTAPPTDPGSPVVAAETREEANQVQAAEELTDLAEDDFADAKEVEAITEYTDEEEANRADSMKPPRGRKNKKDVVSQTVEAPIQSEAERKKGQYQKATAMADLIREAVQHLDREEYHEADSKLQEVLMAQASNVVAMHYKAQVHLRQGQDKEAVFWLKKVVALGGEHFESDQWDLAQAYLRLGKNRAARSVLKDIVRAKGEFSTQAQELLNR
jgi:tetratricopeptide (TPR) repeat protein